MLLYRLMHCAKNNLNLRIKSEPATAGANATVYVRLFGIYSYCWPRNQTGILYCAIASAPTVTGMVIMQKFKLFLGQCAGTNN